MGVSPKVINERSSKLFCPPFGVAPLDGCDSLARRRAVLAFEGSPRMFGRKYERPFVIVENEHTSVAQLPIQRH